MGPRAWAGPLDGLKMIRIPEHGISPHRYRVVNRRRASDCNHVQHRRVHLLLRLRYDVFGGRTDYEMLIRSSVNQRSRSAASDKMQSRKTLRSAGSDSDTLHTS